MDSEDIINNEQNLKGIISVTLKPGKTLDDFCQRNFSNYDKERFEAVAIRFYFGKEMVSTLYAFDKPRGTDGTVPVKKFKTNALPMADILSFIAEFNFTLALGNYPFEDIEVINK